MKTGILLIAHGTVERLDDLPAFLANIRRGHPAPPELVLEVRRRYEAIGGRSPLLDICRDVAKKLEAKMGVATRLAMRLWEPYPKEVLRALAAEGTSRVVVLPLAQHSAKVYGDAVRAVAGELAEEGGPRLEITCAENWGQEPLMVRAYADAIRDALAEVPEGERGATSVLMTAHSLPVAVVRAGDPYEKEVRASAEAIARSLDGTSAAPPRRGQHLAAVRHSVAFQSQGMGTGPGGRPMEWLGPTLDEAIASAVARGETRIVVAPIGFLADHVEILYDLDIEAMAAAKAKGIALTRTRSLNASDPLVAALVAVASPLV
jgi:protoporphyrin/coproporphyrin ferrochelatase